MSPITLPHASLRLNREELRNSKNGQGERSLELGLPNSASTSRKREELENEM